MAEKNGILKKVKSKYIIMKIFENLKQNRLLDIIHYNKKYQKLMNKKIFDYQKAFSKIVIEVIPKENVYGIFINNIYCKSIKSNVEIYFNDDKKEIKRESITQNDNVKKIKIIINHKIKTLYRFFSNCVCIKKISFIKFNRNDITNMSYMFNGCSNLEEINFDKFNTNNVYSMGGMFDDCSSLKELNLSNFNTSKVKYMYHMFKGCSKLKELNLSNFNTNNTNNLFFSYYMFKGCSSLVSLICTNDLIKNEFSRKLN